MSILQKLFGTSSTKEIKKNKKYVDAVFALEEKFSAMTDEELRGMTETLREKLARGATTDEILPEAFATVREAEWRVLGLRAFRVQIEGAVILHQGRIAEMKTGEGKTTTALFPSYLNALTGKAVHVVTVNEYLAKFQGEQMGLVHKFLGLSVGVILHDMTPEQRRAAYACDITYGTNNEFGFDYLRDNMALFAEEMVQRGHHFAIVDEVDSILIDEARTPLIISGMGEESTDDYVKADAFVRKLKSFTRTEEDDSKTGLDYIFDKTAREGERFDTDYTVDYVINEKDRTTQLTAAGIQKAEKYFGIDNLFSTGEEDSDAESSHKLEDNSKDEKLSENEMNEFEQDLSDEEKEAIALREAEEAAAKAEKEMELARKRSDNRKLVHHIEQALKAHGLFKKDVNYVIQNGEIIIVDEFTGRLMYGRRYSEGLHQAIEAKEHVSIRRESRTLATITFQNYFRLYDKLSGMTGTAKTEEEEIRHIYALDVIEIPTNMPMIRKDHPDVIFKTEKAKFASVIEEVVRCHEKGQPVLVGTVSIEKNELLSKMLKAKGVPHNVLNAKQHAFEAEIIAQAGQSGAVTIATNMAGRGTDILLGGNAELLAKKQLIKEFMETEGAEIKRASDAGRLAYKQAVQAVMDPPKNPPANPPAANVELENRVRALRNQISLANPNLGKKELTAAMIKTVDSVFDKQLEAELGRISEIITYEASSKTATTDEKILAVREKYNKLYAEFKVQTNADREKVVAAGGLYVIGTERHESRRIDNQLRGRAGRQGDPGESRFYISMEDDLLRLFGGDRMKMMMDRLTGEEDVALDVKMLSGAIENAQSRIESRNYQMRKRVLEYDDVINIQRETIYKERHRVITGETSDEELREKICGMIRETVSGFAADAISKYSSGKNHTLGEAGLGYLAGLASPTFIGESFFRDNADNMAKMGASELGELLADEAEARFDARTEEFGEKAMVDHCRCVLLAQVTEKWMENIDDMDQLRTGINLRAYGQVDSVNVYKNEGYELYESMLSRIREDTSRDVMTLSPLETRARLERRRSPASPAPKSAPKRIRVVAPGAEPKKAPGSSIPTSKHGGKSSGSKKGK
ncbi:MAG: preprotein translocase subunit SecA [Clostridia bacterium]|nr:preprotein translocase subunit SecA [Clostridia bacterium]